MLAISGHKNTVQGHLDESGQLSEVHAYSAYGLLLSRQHVEQQQLSDLSLLQADPFGYDGEQQDHETRLIYLRARYYNPVTGRFISQDSYNLINRYAFAKSDPVNRVDPRGHLSKKQWLGLAVNLGFGLIAGGLFSGFSEPVFLLSGSPLLKAGLHFLFNGLFSAGSAFANTAILQGSKGLGSSRNMMNYGISFLVGIGAASISAGPQMAFNARFSAESAYSAEEYMNYISPKVDFGGVSSNAYRLRFHLGLLGRNYLLSNLLPTMTAFYGTHMVRQGLNHKSVLKGLGWKQPVAVFAGTALSYLAFSLFNGQYSRYYGQTALLPKQYYLRV